MTFRRCRTVSACCDGAGFVAHSIPCNTLVLLPKGRASNSHFVRAACLGVWGGAVVRRCAPAVQSSTQSNCQCLAPSQSVERRASSSSIRRKSVTRRSTVADCKRSFTTSKSSSRLAASCGSRSVRRARARPDRIPAAVLRTRSDARAVGVCTHVFGAGGAVF